MGQCCGGTLPPENKPNVDDAPKFDSMRASTVIWNNDPEIQALLSQSKARETVQEASETADKVDVVVDDNNDDHHVDSGDGDHHERAGSGSTPADRAILSGDIDLGIKSGDNKASHHKTVPSQSMESSLLTPTQTRIIHDSRATNGSLVVPDSVTSGGRSCTDASDSGAISEDSALNKPQTGMKLSILDEDGNSITKSQIYSSPKSKTRPRPRPLTRDDVEKWGQLLTQQIDGNQLDSNIISAECTHTLSTCPCVQRLVFILKLYHQCLGTDDELFCIQNIMGYIQPFEEYQCLNDYYHLIHHHTTIPFTFSALDSQHTFRSNKSVRGFNLSDSNQSKQCIYSMQQITDFFVLHCGDEFGATDSIPFTRNHRDRTQPLSEGFYNCDATDYQLIAFQQILDSIHCAIFHRIQSIPSRDTQQQVMRRRHPSLYTIDTGIAIKSDHQHSVEMEEKMRRWSHEHREEMRLQQELQQSSSLHAMSSELSSLLQNNDSKNALNAAINLESLSTNPIAAPLKSQQVCKLVSPPIPRQPHPSFGNYGDAAAADSALVDDPNYIISEKEYLALPYSFGPHMFYHYDDAFKKPTYSDLKKELLLNTRAPLTEYQWNVMETKAMMIHKSYVIDPEMTVNQIVALLVYCNFDALRLLLQSSFSDKEEHKKYSHWGHTLFSIIKQFGTTDQQMEHFEAMYCALNFPYKFHSFNHFNFNGLFSATPHLDIVSAGDISDDGIILKLNSSHFGVAPFIEISTIFSDFKDECHHLFGFSNGCVLQIDEVFTTFDLRNDTPSATHRNQQYIASLQLLEQMVIDMLYVDDRTQYQWLQRSLQRDDDDDDGDSKFSVIQILEFMITDCLGLKEENEMKSVPEIPSFIETQIGFFRHCLRETEYCRLCCDLKKMELCPPSIRSLFLNAEQQIAFGIWCRLFPNDRVIAVKNVQKEHYGSFIDAFTAFLGDPESKELVECLECIDIDTDSKEHCQEMEEMVEEKNNGDLKGMHWMMEYEMVRKRIGNDQRDSYSILIKKEEGHNNAEREEDGEQKKEEKERGKEDEEEMISPLHLEEVKTLDEDGVDELCANIMNAVEEQKKKEETPMSSDTYGQLTASPNPFAGRWSAGFGTDNDTDRDATPLDIDGFVTPRSLNEHESNSQPTEPVH